MKALSNVWFHLVLVACLTSCYSTNLPYDNPKKISENVYEFKYPRYTYTPTYTGISVFSASALGITLYSINNPWYSIEDKKSPTASAVVGVSGVFVTAALIKLLFYSNTVREGNEQEWLDRFNYKLTFINGTYGKVLSSSSFLGTYSVTREVVGIKARLFLSQDTVKAAKDIYDFDKMFFDNKGK